MQAQGKNVFIGIVEGTYSTIRLYEMLLKAEGHHVHLFGRFEQLERCNDTFDLLLVNPGLPNVAAYILSKLTALRPETRKVICTKYEEVFTMALAYDDMVALLMPCRHGMFMAVVEGLKPYIWLPAPEDKEGRNDDLYPSDGGEIHGS